MPEPFMPAPSTDRDPVSTICRALAAAVDADAPNHGARADIIVAHLTNAGYTIAREPHANWHLTLDHIERALSQMSEDDRNDAIEALRSRFDEQLYTRP
jgi:2-methylisocitrate lyase-like PEP mutase family enzyme